MEALLDCREEATVGKYCEQDVEIKRLETLLRIKGEVLPEVVLFVVAIAVCLNQTRLDEKAERRPAAPLSVSVNSVPYE